MTDRKREIIFLALLASFPLALAWYFKFQPISIFVKNKPLLNSMLILGIVIQGINCLLSYKIAQSRIFHASILNAFVIYAVFKLSTFTEVLSTDNRTIFSLLALAFPLMYSMIYFVPEHKIFSAKGLAHLAVTLAPLVLMIIWLKVNPQSMQAAAKWRIFSEWRNFPLPQAIFLLVAFNASLIGLLYLTVNQKQEVNSTVFSTLLPLLGGFAIAISLGGKTNSIKTYTAIFQISVGILFFYRLFVIYWRSVYIDELTQLLNRRALDEELATLSGDYSIALLDIDHFKNFNDTYGHQEGDSVLKYTASHFKVECPFRVFRYGGEEFCILFPDYLAEDVIHITNKIRRKLAEKKFFIRASQEIREKTSKRDRGVINQNKKSVTITISIGLANSTSDTRSSEEVVKLADQALYKAKENGRNRVELFQEVPKIRPVGTRKKVIGLPN